MIITSSHNDYLTDSDLVNLIGLVTIPLPQLFETHGIYKIILMNFSMPQILERADFSATLKKPSLNTIQTKKFLAKYPITYHLDGVELPKSFSLLANRKGTSIRLIDRHSYAEPRIVYAVDIEVTDTKIKRKSCTQVLVWASPNNEDLLIGFPRKVFNHLLEKYIIMITDYQQTPDGKRFWERRIVQALADKKFVYFVDNTVKNAKLVSIRNSDNFFENFEPIGWGNDDLQKNKLFLISMDELVDD